MDSSKLIGNLVKYQVTYFHEHHITLIIQQSMILFFSFVSIIQCTVIGIDLGSDTIKVAVGSKTMPVHLVTNLYSNKKTPNVFAFKNKTSWAFGEDAADLCEYHPYFCVRPIPLDNEDYTLGETLKGYEIVALSLLQIIQDVKAVENINDEIKVVIAIPPSTNVREKSFLYNALTVAGLQALKFVTSTYAPIEFYANELQHSSSNTAVFIDVGHSGVSVSSFTFSKNQIIQTFGEYNDQIGGRTIDEHLFTFLRTKYNIQLSTTNYQKEKSQLLSLIQKARETLITSKSRISFTFKRQTITLTSKDVSTEHCKEIIDCVSLMIRNLKRQQNIQHAHVGLLGGCSQIQSIRRGIRNIIRLDQSFDPFAAVAMGAVYSATNEIPSSSSVHDALITTETILKTESKVYKLFDNEKKENYAPMIRLSKVDQSQLYHLIDKSDNEKEFLRFSLTNLGYLERNRHDFIDLTVVLNDFLIPVPYQPVSLVSDADIGINTIRIGWEVSKEKLERSKNRVQMIYTLVTKRHRYKQRLNEIEQIKAKADELLNQYGYFNWRRFALNGIWYYINSLYSQCLENYDFKCAEKRIHKIAKTYKDMILYIIGVDLNYEPDEAGRRNAIKMALDEFYDLLEACRFADVDVQDLEEWIERNIDRATLQDINEKLEILKNRGKQAQEHLFREL